MLLPLLRWLSPVYGACDRPRSTRGRGDPRRVRPLAFGSLSSRAPGWRKRTLKRSPLEFVQTFVTRGWADGCRGGRGRMAVISVCIFAKEAASALPNASRNSG